MNSNSQPVIVRGIIEALKFHNAENGYTIARLRLEDETHIFISGQLVGSCVGERIEAEGVWVKHSARAGSGANGWHVDIKRYTLLPPTNVNDLHSYLVSAIKVLTPELAARLVESFGLDTLQVIEQKPERLKEIKGLTARQIQQIQTSWKGRQKWNQLRMLLQTPGFPRAAARRVYQAYSQIALATPKQSKPVLRDLYAIDFASAEQIAPLLELPPNAPARVEYGLRHILKEFGEQGHVLVPRADLIRQSAQLLGVSEKVIQSGLRRLVKTRELIIEHERVYRSELFDAEVAAAERLRDILATRKARLSAFQTIEWSKTFNWLAFNAKIVLTPEQQTAVQTALTSKISILTGGPGTGKTTTLRAIVALLKKRAHTFLLTAPTARAAKRLSEASGAPAQTLHRLLQFKPAAQKKDTAADKKFARARTAPLAADLIIVDECSMLDLLLLNDLLQSMNPASHILFVGDPHQLPSIGAGKVLQDLIDSDAIPVVTLSAVLRQAKDSLIVLNAHRIQHGQLPNAMHIEHARRVRDFLMIAEKEPTRAVRRIVALVAKQLPARFGFDPLQDIQVLCPMNHGPAGVVELNRALQAALNPPRADKAEWAQASRILRVGDKVAQTQNDYERGVFNGDIGRIIALDVDKQMLTVAFEETRVDYLFSELEQLTQAFALSVHKAQGSEYPAVVILMLNTHGKLLQRNLLYTAVTRARELTVLVATRTALVRAVRNNQLAQRHSYLAPRLAHAMRTVKRAPLKSAAVNIHRRERRGENIKRAHTSK